MQVQDLHATLRVVKDMAKDDVESSKEALQWLSPNISSLEKGTHTAMDSPQNYCVAPAVLWFRDRLLISTLVVVFFIDQASKYVIKSNLDLHESWPRDGIFRLTHGTNTGTAFGLFPDQTFVLIVASFLAIGFLLYLYRTQTGPSRLLRFAIGLQIGGAFGNLFDRIRNGEVIDFIDIGWWPVFNLADSCIVVGITLLISFTLLHKEFKQIKGSQDNVDSSSQ